MSPSNRAEPPRLAGALLDLAEGAAGTVRGDMDEEFRRFVLPSVGRRAAHIWYWRQTTATLTQLLLRRARRTTSGAFRGAVGELGRAARIVCRRPRSFLAMALTFALGLGAGTAAFAVVHAVLLRPLPYAEEQRMVRIHPDEAFYIQLHGAQSFAEHAVAFDAVLPWARTLFTFTGDGSAEEVRGALVSWDHFQTLGVRPELGRAFRRQEAESWPYDSVILGHGLWVRRYGADPEVIGSRVDVGGRLRTVVGVLGSDHVPGEPDWEAWAPLPLDPEPMRGNGMAMNARMRPGVDLSTATRDARRALAAAWGELRDLTAAEAEAARAVRVIPLHDHLLGSVERPLWILFAAAVGVLLLACTNVAMLLLALGERRRGEIATRIALGASMRRVARQLVLETTLAATAGTALGLLGAWVVVSWSHGRLPSDVPRASTIDLGLASAGYAAAALVSCVLLVAAVPVRHTVRGGLRESMSGSGRSAGSRGGVLRAGLVGAEVALAVVLLTGAGLMLRSVAALGAVDPGFDPEGVVATRVGPPPGSYEAEGALDDLFRRLQEEVSELPDVEEVGAVMFLPMTSGGAYARFRVTPAAEPDAPSVSYRIVTPGYIEALGIPLRGGRSLNDDDASAGEPVAMVNEEAARLLLPGESAVGSSLYPGAEGAESFRIVGVVGDVRQRGLREPPVPEIYLPLAQNPFTSMYLVARTTGDPGRTLALIQRRIHAVDADIVLSRSTLGPELLGASMAEARIVAQLLTLFAAVAVLLGAAGVYGVTAHAVSGMKREVGIRMALGAAERGVVAAVVWRGMTPVLAGLVVGMGAAGLASGVLRQMIFDVPARDPLTFVLAPLVLSLVALASIAGPALRAGRVDPAGTLKGVEGG